MAEKKIADKEYRVELLGAKDAYLLLAEIIRIAGPGAKHLPAIVALVRPDEEGAQFMADVAAFAACAEVLNTHGAEALVDLKARVLGLAQVKRPAGHYEKIDLEVDFYGALDQAEELFDYVMEVQFGNFSQGSEASGPIALAMVLVRNIFRIQKSSR
ncbi:MAG: phage tail assembly chaperone [Pseudomonadota bacterium]